jgi:hypothetical protein
MSVLKRGNFGCVTLADIALYQFLEFAKDCYGVDMTIGSGEKVLDVYGREVVERFQKLVEFYEAFRSRDSAVKYAEKGEVASYVPMKMMQAWADGA